MRPADGAKATDVVVLGAGFRGLWLAAELKKLGWSVAWAQLRSPQSGARKGGFRFDDWPWQIGPFRPQSKLMPLVKDFVEKAFVPLKQEISVQILTPQGPLELSGPARKFGLKKFFSKNHDDLAKYLDGITTSRSLEEQKGSKLLFAHTKKIFSRPLGERWCLEWLGALRRSRAVTTGEWILEWFRDVLNPNDEVLLLESGLDEVVARGMKWAEKQGVAVVPEARVTDIGIENGKATGIEIAGRGFFPCKHIVVCCSHETALKEVPRLANQMMPAVKQGTERWAWIRCGFLLKPGSKPEGCLPFSSFVMDPYLPLNEANAGVLRWIKGEDGDSLTVWVRIPFGELKRRSFLMNLTESIQKNMSQLFPRFAQQLKAVFPFEEYFHSPEVGHDDLAIVFGPENRFDDPRSKLKNVWLAGPGQDRGLEFLSQLATEWRALNQLALFRKKELKKSDRKIHSARNGRPVVHAK